MLVVDTCTGTVPTVPTVKGDFWDLGYCFLCTLFKFNTASSGALQILLCRKMLGSNPELWRLWHWQSDALTTQLDRIHTRLPVQC
jgi:hypothetical protein